MRERSKSKRKLGGTKVCKAEEVRINFANPKTENEVFGQCTNYIVSSLDVMNSLFITYGKNVWCHFVVRIGSPALISFYCECFASFYFFLVFYFSVDSTTY